MGPFLLSRSVKASTLRKPLGPQTPDVYAEGQTTRTLEFLSNAKDRTPNDTAKNPPKGTSYRAFVF